jgi:hypothetical protein
LLDLIGYRRKGKLSNAFSGLGPLSILENLAQTAPKTKCMKERKITGKEKETGIFIPVDRRLCHR